MQADGKTVSIGLSPTQFKVKAPNQTTVFDQSSQYGKLNELTQRTTQDHAVDYTYDDAMRLTEADPSSGTTETYQLDAASNRTQDHTNNSTWQYDAANRLTQRGTISYQYDAASNLITKTNTALTEPRRTTYYAYDGYNRLIEVKDGQNQVVSKYTYDPLGYRISKEVTTTGAANTNATAGKTLFLQSKQGLLAQTNASGQIQQSYGWQPQGMYSTDPLFTRVGTNYYYYHNDHLGQPRQLTDKQGQVVWQANRITAFGTVSVASNATIEQPWRFPGQYVDQETGLHYNVHRYYDADTGRYVTQDPIGLNGGLNVYAYVGGNPVGFIDPLGLVCIATGNTVRCQYGSYPCFSFPRPIGWPDRIDDDHSWYHGHDIPVSQP